MSNIRSTLLEIVKEILTTGLDSDDVNSINDTEEALQVANIVKNTFFDMVSRRELPEHRELTQINSLADSTRPTMLVLPSNVKNIEKLEYNVSETDNAPSFRELDWVTPEQFLYHNMLKNVEDVNTTTMKDINSNVDLVIRTNKMPTVFTSFDDKHLVCDSYKSTVDDVLQTSKTRAFVVKFPTFDLEDSFVPDLNDVHFRTLVNEAKSMSISVIQKTINAKIESTARTQKVRTQNDFKRVQENKGSYGFGRKRNHRILRKGSNRS